MGDEHTEVSEATRQAEAEEGQASHVAGRPATSQEEESIEDAEVDRDVRAHYQEMVELGAQEAGEGRIP